MENEMDAQFLPINWPLVSVIVYTLVLWQTNKIGAVPQIILRAMVFTLFFTPFITPVGGYVYPLFYFAIFVGSVTHPDGVLAITGLFLGISTVVAIAMAVFRKFFNS